MDVTYINPILESTLTVLSTMAMVEAKPEKPHLKDNTRPLGDITGQIDLTGDHIRGSLAISFSESSILDISEKLLGEAIQNIDDTVADVVGELTNMITGNAKRIYSEQGLDFNLTLPKTTIGNGQQVLHSIKGKTVVLPFTTTSGRFYVEFVFDC